MGAATDQADGPKALSPHLDLVLAITTAVKRLLWRL